MDAAQDEPVNLLTQIPSSIKVNTPIDVHIMAGKPLIWDAEGIVLTK